MRAPEITTWRSACVLALALAPVIAYAQEALPPGYGSSPQVAEPSKPGLLPTIKWAAVRPWPKDKTPKVAAGLKVDAFARDLKHPRWLYVLPNGDVLEIGRASCRERV